MLWRSASFATLKTRKISSRELPKTPTGIRGLDEITYGGLPKGRPSLVCGSAGCGKTLLGLEFLVNGARNYSEPGVFMAFEETPEELIANVSSLGFELDRLVEKKMIALDHIRVERSEIEEPSPRRVLVGDFSRDDRVLAGLSLAPIPAAS